MRWMNNNYPALLLFVLFCSGNLVFADDKDGWTCKKDGYWYENDVKSDWPCSKDDEGDGKGKDNNPCNHTNDDGMPAAYPRTCIDGPPDNVPRCWWTYVPEAVKADANLKKVPLIIDMHGGGGCASHEALASGFKELSDTLGKDAFITVWPMGYGSQWGTCGSDCAEVKEDNDGKSVHSVDDISFLSSMVATIIKSQADSNPSKNRIDPERIYATGFSMGCMMSHRLALERSTFLAGFGCHGGTIIQKKDPNLAAEKKRFNLSSMPAYMTGGSKDDWFEIASLTTWATWNGCSAPPLTTDITLPGDKSTAAKLDIRSSCNASSNNLETVRLEIMNAGHVMDDRMANYTWEYLKKFKRAGALSELLEASPIVVPTEEKEKPSSVPTEEKEEPNSAKASLPALIHPLMITITTALCSFS